MALRMLTRSLMRRLVTTSKRRLVNCTSLCCERHAALTACGISHSNLSQPSFRSLTTFAPEKYIHLYTLESWSHAVHPFGRLTINVPFNVKVVPLNPDNHPEMNRAFVTLYADREHGHEMKEIMEWNSYCHMNVELKNFDKDLEIRGSITDQGHKAFQGGVVPLECLVHVPLKFALDIHVTEEGNANIENMESRNIMLLTQQGDVLMKNVKAGSAIVHSWSGNINIKKGLKGNIDLKTGQRGTILADKIQGSDVKCQTEEGDIRVKSVYGDSLVFWTKEGYIHLGSLHGRNVIDIKDGKLKIDSLDGDLNALIGKGSVDIHLVRHEDVNIHSKHGDVLLRLPDPANAHTSYSLKGDMIKFEDVFLDHREEQGTENGQQKCTGSIGDTYSGRVQVWAETGNIRVMSQDWFSSLNI